MTGIQYTDANAVLPTKAILAIASIMCALMFLTVIWTKSWRLPIVGVGPSARRLGGGRRDLPGADPVPAGQAQREVVPSAVHPEQHQRHPRGVRARQRRHQALQRRHDGDPGPARNDTTTVPGIRILDPNVVSATYKQLQAGKSYYQFPDTLDVDRYSVDGRRATP